MDICNIYIMWTALSKSYHLLWSLDTLVKPRCTGRYRWFLEGLWILVMPWSKVLIAHKELGWKLPHNTIGKKHKNDRYVKEGKGGTLQSVSSSLWTQSYPPNFFEGILHFKGALLRLHCESSLVLLQSFWKQGSKITSSLHPILKPNLWKVRILDYRDELFRSMDPFPLLKPNDTSLMKSCFELFLFFMYEWG
jgi:hypothetical protein